MESATIDIAGGAGGGAGGSRVPGALPSAAELTDIARLVTAYYTEIPDLALPGQGVAFGTSGHRGSATAGTFTDRHVAAVTQAICRYRAQQGIDGPLFLGIDTHALSVPAASTALEVLAANGVEVMIAEGDAYTPTPVISHAVLTHNRGRERGLADGIVITPSHNPPADGGFKYNPPNGGPADTDATGWIEAAANALLRDELRGVARWSQARALRAPTTHRHDFIGAYVNDLASVLDFDAIRAGGIRMGVDPLGGSGVAYWGRIAERYRLDLTVVNDLVDPTFRFVTLDWDGQIRLDPSSAFAMRGLIGMKDRFDIAFACDTDHDRHGIVTRGAGLLPSNHYLTALMFYLFQHRPGWAAGAAMGKTVVSSRMIDLVARQLGRRVFEVPVGFKWFVSGLIDGSLGLVGEESAGATCLRRDGTVWTTDKDGMVPALLAAEMTAVIGRDPGEVYAGLAAPFGDPLFTRVDARATPPQKERLKKLSVAQVTSSELAGEPIDSVLTHAPGNGAAIGGLKVTAAHGWFAARPSGTEDIYKIYAESFRGEAHLRAIVAAAQQIVSAALTAQ